MVRLTRGRIETIIILLGLIVIGVSLARPAGQARAFAEQYRMFPGLDSTDLYQYGAHFDEGTSYDYMARDFNRPSDAEGNQSAYLRVQLSTTLSTPLVFKLTRLNVSCDVLAQAGYWSGSTFVPYTGETFHYLHINNDISNPTYTTGITQNNASVYVYIGTVAVSGSSCWPGATHLHQSADVGVSTPVFRNVVYTSGETCWSNYWSTHTWQCPSSYKTHATSPDSFGHCGSYSGYLGDPSGTADQYTCEEWSYSGQTSLAAWGTGDKVFYVLK